MKIHPWMLVYLLERMFKPVCRKPKHIFLAVCDHFEPLWNKASDTAGLSRVRDWIEKYPKITNGIKDSDGFMPKHTFFYPIEEYRPQIMQELAHFCKSGFGEVEVHLHHDNDTSDHLRKTLVDYKTMLYEKFGLLCKDKADNQIKYGFIHGNWALDNSRRDGRHCGVNNEIDILRETGCYADFTLPSAPDVSQTTKINSIYYAVDDPLRPKSHGSGINAEKGKSDSPGLLMVQGPLALNFKQRKWGLFPRIENSDISYTTRISLSRIHLWISAGIAVRGAEDSIFIKIYTHGCQENNAEYLLFNGLKDLFNQVKNCAAGLGSSVHFVSARELVNIVKTLVDAQSGKDLNSARDFRYVRS